ncbi:MAG: hypothetical protein H0V82_01795 [Candidatus Protochlamydia sp.]|nr:hypothetical protein [Candidatus Protochlamydia sp.]
MAIDWNQGIEKAAAAAVCVAYFAVTGSLMTRVVTKIAVSPAIGAISGAIFGVLCTLQRKKDINGIFSLLVLNTLATLPLACYNYPGNNHALIGVAGGLTALHITNLIAISTLWRLTQN